MSRYQPYLNYKDSGVEWLGEVPEHWQSIKFKHILFDKKKESNIDLSCGSISFGEVVFKDDEKIPEETKASYQEVLAGEFLVNPLNLNYDLKSLRTALSKIDVVVSSGYIVLKSHDNSNKNYLRWLLYQFDVAHMKTLGSGVRQTINYADIGNSYFLEPTPDEQTAIANFLDIQTAKIDTLIAKQQRMIELLGEKRAAMISHAVTKGINPDVSMKDSGVEWLGEVPEHWEVKKLKYNLRLQTQKVTIDGHSVIALENIESKSGKYVSTESSYQGEDVEFKASDILFGKLRPYLAKVYKCNSNGVAFGDLLTYRPTKYFDSSFAFYSLLSEAFIRIVDSSTYGAKMPRASSEFINEMLLTTPPLPEQIAIAGHLDIQTTKIDTLIAKARQAIELMKERRTALISAAVTGKIDVRGM